MKKNKKMLALVCCMALLVGAVGATLAWLTDTSGPVNNTFTVGDVDINMDETNVDNTLTGKIRDTENSYKMIPGFTIDKDPIITITKDSEPCWVFVEVTETFNKITVDGVEYDFDDFIEYNLVDGWGLVEGTENVYAQLIDNPSAYSSVDTGLHVVRYGNQIDKVAVKSTVTKAMMDAVTLQNYPKLTFNAYAVQKYETNGDAFSAEEAWAIAKPPTP